MSENQPNFYDFSTIEEKWQDYWASNKTFAVSATPAKPKFYVLDMFPYPSGAGLHVGHPEGYTASDIVSRYKRMKGFNVLHPMGYDAFGLPAEQYAVQTGTHPRITTESNINKISRQIKSFGFSYDWDRQINTTDPKYYRWTQWIFLKLFNSFFNQAQRKALPINELPIPENLSDDQKRRYIDDHRLAYQAEVSVNWCQELGTVLANEEVIGGISERGGYSVVRKPMRQWMLRITAYAERLLEDLDGLDWSEGIKKLQKDWVGKSIGADVDFEVDGHDNTIRVFTTRPDTLFGATYMVLAPEHRLVDIITTDQQRAAVGEYRRQAARKSDLDRTDLAKEKTGVETGAYAINPVNQEKIPIWISDYVLISYGTGAIMAVPAHDTRDFEFAKTFGLAIIPVVKPDRKAALALKVSTSADTDAAFPDGVVSDEVTEEEMNAVADSIIEKVMQGEECFVGDGTAVNSGRFDGLTTAEFKEKITSWLQERGQGKKATNYKLRDWLFSRQRYWGEPFPIVHLEDGSVVALDESELPLALPEVESYKPSGTGESPLANERKWLEITYNGQKAKRETNTMPQWAGSCWYYLRYIDAHNDQALVDPEKERYWMPVDLYVGGAEHAVLHLLYARFWHKVLYDLGYVSTKEPFQKLVNQGMILGLSYKDGRGALVANDMVEHRDDKHFHKETGEQLEEFTAKMSKSLKNVVNPDDVIHKYGADSMRLYEMFMGPLDASKPWNMQGVEGVYRFLQKSWRMIVGDDGNLHSAIVDIEPQDKHLRLLHQTIKKVTDDIEAMAFNTAISQMMIFVNEYLRLEYRSKKAVEAFVLLLSPFAPHIAEEFWQLLGHDKTLAYEPWPTYDEALTHEPEVELAVQINGKIRDRVTVPADSDDEAIKQKVLESDCIKGQLEGKTVCKVIVIKNRLVNIVVG